MYTQLDDQLLKALLECWGHLHIIYIYNINVQKVDSVYLPYKRGIIQAI